MTYDGKTAGPQSTPPRGGPKVRGEPPIIGGAVGGSPQSAGPKIRGAPRSAGRSIVGRPPTMRLREWWGARNASLPSSMARQGWQVPKVRGEPPIIGGVVGSSPQKNAGRAAHTVIWSSGEIVRGAIKTTVPVDTQILRGALPTPLFGPRAKSCGAPSELWCQWTPKF
jgi:hypothetical protein